MKRYTTQNSVYEVREEERLVRRVTGVNENGTHRLMHGDWEEYVQLDNVELVGLIIQWTEYRPGSSHTITSPVVKIEDV